MSSGPQMVAVDSSSIARVGYDDDARELYVQFVGGSKTYAYLDVPPERHAELMAAESKGTYVNTEIKPNYKYRVVS